MNNSSQHRGWIVALGLLICAGIGTLMAAPAAAHTDLLTTDPADGDRLGAPPTALTLTFTEEMSPGLSTITARVDNGETMNLDVVNGASPTELVATVPEARAGNESGLSDPTQWHVAYRVVSRDGHPVAGSYTFTVRPSAGQKAPATSEATTAPSPPTQADADAGRDEPTGASGGVLAFIGLVTLGLVVLTGIATVRLIRRGRGA
ncbi:copper resistance CopC family protein [Nocardioides sp. 31GB23]|uniref:copper resistance CopC family protein n=1 Tax=Nocardioides sp. 31GB23 TaxID=3156065 RepID=UPI0032AFDA05